MNEYFQELLEKFSKEVEEAPAIKYDYYIYIDFYVDTEEKTLVLSTDYSEKTIEIKNIELSHGSFWINDDQEVVILEYKKVK